MDERRGRVDLQALSTIIRDIADLIEREAQHKAPWTLEALAPLLLLSSRAAVDKARSIREEGKEDKSKELLQLCSAMLEIVERTQLVEL